MAKEQLQGVVSGKMSGAEGAVWLKAQEDRRVSAMAEKWGVWLHSVSQRPFGNSVLVTLEFDIESQPEARLGNTLVWRFCKATFPSMYNQKQWIDIVDSRKRWYISWFINFNVKDVDFNPQ